MDFLWITNRLDHIAGEDSLHIRFLVQRGNLLLVFDREGVLLRAYSRYRERIEQERVG